MKFFVDAFNNLKERVQRVVRISGLNFTYLLFIYLSVQVTSPSTELYLLCSLPPWEQFLLSTDWIFCCLLIGPRSSSSLLEINQRPDLGFPSRVKSMNSVAATPSKERILLISRFIDVFQVESGMQNVWPPRQWNFCTPRDHFHFRSGAPYPLCYLQNFL